MIIIVLVVLVLLGAGVGIYFYMNGSSSADDSSSSVSTAPGATVTDQSTETVTNDVGQTVTTTGAGAGDDTATATDTAAATNMGKETTANSTGASGSGGAAKTGATSTTKAALGTGGSATAVPIASATGNVTPSAGFRKFTIANGCDYTIWPAIFTGAGPQPDVKTGWEAASGTSVDFLVAEGWDGRIWGRLGCDFSGDSTLPSTCLTGGCNGGLECATLGGTGVAPASLLEFNIANNTNYPIDNYDMSLVDGFNLPIEVTNDAGCPVSACSVDLNQDCPEEAMTVYSDSSNTTKIGCYTDCGAFGLDQYCCAGANNLPSTCPGSGIPHFAYFHSVRAPSVFVHRPYLFRTAELTRIFSQNCPTSYAYAYDDSNALFTCDMSKAANFVITFCPSDMKDPVAYTSGEALESMVANPATGAASGSGATTAAATGAVTAATTAASAAATGSAGAAVTSS